MGTISWLTSQSVSFFFPKPILYSFRNRLKSAAWRHQHHHKNYTVKKNPNYRPGVGEVLCWVFSQRASQSVLCVVFAFQWSSEKSLVFFVFFNKHPWITLKNWAESLIGLKILPARSYSIHEASCLSQHEMISWVNRVIFLRCLAVRPYDYQMKPRPTKVTGGAHAVCCRDCSNQIWEHYGFSCGSNLRGLRSSCDTRYSIQAPQRRLQRDLFEEHPFNRVKQRWEIEWAGNTVHGCADVP